MTDPGQAMLIPLGIILLLNGVLFVLLPRLTRPEVYFAVTVPKGFRDSEKGRRIVRRFRLWVVGATVLAAVLLLAAQRWLGEAFAIAAVLGQVAVLLPAFLAARKETMGSAVDPSRVMEVSLEPRPTWGWGELVLHAGPIGVVGAVAFTAVLRWNRLPARLPIHWGVDGSVDGWITRTQANLATLLLSIAVMAGVISFIAWTVGRGVRRIRTRGPAAKAERRFRGLMRAVTVGAAYFVTAPAVMLGLTSFGVEVESPWVWILPILALLACVGVAFWWGQGGSRLAAEKGAREGLPDAPLGDRTDDRCWKLGLFYVNRSDPALLVEKRFGVGYTVNFGNRWSWLIIGLLLGVPLLLSLIPGLLH